MDRAHQNELKTAYRNQEILGGIYCIQCVPTRQVWVRSARNLAGAQNKFAFAVSIQSCPEPALREVWTQHGAQAFTFAVLETLKKGEDQTETDYAEDLRLLLAMWREKTEKDGLPPAETDATRSMEIPPTGTKNPA